MADTPQTPPADSSLRDLGISFVVLAGMVIGGIYYSRNPQSAIVNPQSRITLIWDNPAEAHGTFTTEIWSTTNLTTWTLRTNVSGTNAVTLPADKPREFFKARNKGTNGVFSDWSRKPTL